MSLGTGAGQRTPSRTRAVIFAVVCVVCLAGGIGYAMHSAWRAQSSLPTIVSAPIERVDAVPTVPEHLGASSPAPLGSAPPANVLGPSSAGTKSAAARTEPKHPQNTVVAKVEQPSIAKDTAAETAGAASSESLTPARPYMLFRSTALGETYGRVSLTYLDGSEDPRYVSPLRCDRVHFAAGHGLCLEAKRGVFTTFQAHIFDRDFQIRHTFALTGIPSRARLSPDGRRAALTVFVSGHSYAGSDFSTRTSIVDAANGKILVEDLEGFVVLKDGAPFKANDFNFWGVTFTRDADRFYATLGSGGRFYLIDGDVTTRQARVVHEGIECPSLSPDNTRVAFKRRIGTGERLGRFIWRLYVLDLATLAETALSRETRSVDDQVEWLDNDQIVYALPDDVPHATAATNTWALASDGSGAPRLLMSLAFSPAVVR